MPRSIAPPSESHLPRLTAVRIVVHVFIVGYEVGHGRAERTEEKFSRDGAWNRIPNPNHSIQQVLFTPRCIENLSSILCRQRERPARHGFETLAQIRCLSYLCTAE